MYDSLVSKAIGEVRDEFSGSFLVVVVCAGWNAELDATTSMKESFCAKQLAMCRTTIDLMRWARMNSGGLMQFDIVLSSAPKVLYHTNAEYQEELQQLNCAAFPSDFERKYYNDQVCQDYLKDKLGQRGLEHYKALVIGAHRAFFSHMCCYSLRVEYTWT